MDMQKQGIKPGKKLAVWAGLSVLYVLTRGMLVLPWVFLNIPKNDDLTTVLRCAVTLLIWMFVVLPEHGFHCWTFMRMNGDDDTPYSYWKALKIGLYRALRVSYAAVPVVALSLLLYYTMTSNIGSLRILKDIGSIFGAQRRYGYDVGLAIILVVLLVSLIVLAVFWYRHTPNDYLRTVRPFRLVRFDGLTVRNFVLAAAAYVLWTVILYLFLFAQLSEYSGLMAKMTKLPRALRTVLSQREFLLEMGLVLILVYCPLWCVRKHGAAKSAAKMRDAA